MGLRNFTVDNLKVKIPKKFKKSLKRRFDLKKIEYESHGGRKLYFIKGKCELCLKYFFRCENRCASCPFERFGNEKVVGCAKWIEKVIGKPYFSISHIDVNWWEKNNEKAQKQIKELKRKAKKLIQWV